MGKVSKYLMKTFCFGSLRQEVLNCENRYSIPQSRENYISKFCGGGSG